MTTSKARLVITFSGFLATALEASKAAGISNSSVIVLDGPGHDRDSVSELIALGAKSPLSYKELKLKPGEAKTKIAFLSFSSGTTGVYLDCHQLMFC